MSGSGVKTKPSQQARSGFTLVEMLLVLGVFIVFAGITIPSVMRMFGQQKLTHAAERVRESVASARFRAIDTGLIYQFCCESGGSRFVVVPFEPDHPVTGGSGPAAPVILQGRSWGQLPKGIVFSSVGLNSALPTSSTPTTSTPNTSTPNTSTPNTSTRATTTLSTAPTHKLAAGSLDGLPNAGELAGANWSVPILFHPEGTANADLEITVSDSKSQQIKLRVRAFTGAVSMERLAVGKR
jgi:type II secretory pathway pseudopilin PulG